MIQSTSFTKEECSTIINLSLELEGSTSDVNSKNVKKHRENISYTYYNIYKNKKVEWIFDRITDYLLYEQNIEVIKPFDIIHLHKYLAGNKFNRHRDIYFPNQVLNVGVCLNDNYDGGDFILYNPTQLIPKKAGLIYSFKNTTEHEVKEITKGIRYSLIIFLYKDNLKLKNNLI
jgi:hypothetical protein